VGETFSVLWVLHSVVTLTFTRAEEALTRTLGVLVKFTSVSIQFYVYIYVL
jgi:hypothetical protein